MTQTGRPEKGGWHDDYTEDLELYCDALEAELARVGVVCQCTIPMLTLDRSECMDCGLPYEETEQE